MDTNVQALKNLYVALGGDLSTVANLATNSEVINAIAQLPTLGAILPSVTAADNGKVLGVVNGAWTTMEIPEGLPAVTETDNGKILKVVDGEWAIGTDLTE